MDKRVIPAAPDIPGLEPLKQDMYDTKSYPAAGVAVLEFFRNPNPGGELFTNMAASGQLPYPQQYHAMGLAVEILPNVVCGAAAGGAAIWATEKKKIRENAWLKLHIGSKDYLTIPLKRVPEGVGPHGFGASALATGIVALTNGVQDLSHHYDLTVRMGGKIQPIHIPSQQSFFVQIYWPQLVVHSFSGTGEYVIVRVYLAGVLWREVQ